MLWGAAPSYNEPYELFITTPNFHVQSSYLNSSILAPRGQVVAVENNLRNFGHGPDTGGGQTEELLTNIYNRFGPISSFTGTYIADEWRLTINRGNPDSGMS
jgi:hypothetical protein